MGKILILIAVPVFLVALALTAFTHIFFRIPYVPSRQKIVNLMIELADLKSDEVVYDLGCGDGRILITAEKHAKIQGIGFEIAPLVYLTALVKKWLTGAKFTLEFRNLFRANFKKADVIFCYLIPSAMEKLAEKFKQECKKGARVITHTFKLPGFNPIRVIPKNKKSGTPTIYLYKI